MIAAAASTGTITGSNGAAASLLTGVALSVLAGCLVAVGTYTFYVANHLAIEHDPSTAVRINSIYCLVPVGALIALWVTGTALVARAEMLIVGAAGVIAVNMVLHLDPDHARHIAETDTTQSRRHAANATRQQLH